MAMGNCHGDHVGLTYTRGYWCDLSVAASSKTGCEVGSKWRVAPSTQHDPLIITVPLGFSVNHQMDCPDKLTCVDHPATLDLTRLAPALAPIFKTTPATLLPALRNFTTPGHDHFIADLNQGKAEWWDVYVVGVTDRATYDDLQVHQSYSYLRLSGPAGRCLTCLCAGGRRCRRGPLGLRLAISAGAVPAGSSGGYARDLRRPGRHRQGRPTVPGLVGWWLLGVRPRSSGDRASVS